MHKHLAAAQPLELLLQHGHVDGGAVEAVLQHDELRWRDERRWRQAEQAQQHAWSPVASPRGSRRALGKFAANSTLA